MNKRQELRQWLRNYKQIKEQLRNAFYFKNEDVIDNLAKRLVMTQRMISECAADLEKQSNTDASNAVGSTKAADVKVTKDSSMYLNCPRGLPRG